MRERSSALQRKRSGRNSFVHLSEDPIPRSLASPPESTWSRASLAFALMVRNWNPMPPPVLSLPKYLLISGFHQYIVQVIGRGQKGNVLCWKLEEWSLTRATQTRKSDVLAIDSTSANILKRLCILMEVSAELVSNSASSRISSKEGLDLWESINIWKPTKAGCERAIW